MRATCLIVTPRRGRMFIKPWWEHLWNRKGDFFHCSSSCRETNDTTRLAASRAMVLGSLALGGVRCRTWVASGEFLQKRQR